MARFVLLLHECPDARPRPTHCDLMLEIGATLRTWALSELPRDWKFLTESSVVNSISNTVEVERLADHRLAYLDYEGPVSGGRGVVRRIDAGTCRELQESAVFACIGHVIRGTIELQPIVGDDACWRLQFTAE